MTDNTEPTIDELVEEMVDRGALPSEYVDLIANQVAKAKIEELELINDKLYDITTATWGEPTEGSIKDWGENHADLYVPTRDMHRVLEYRIATLNGVNNKSQEDK